ncbi:hypothetical protein OG194_11430 [Streptomyces sp. NBC_01288]|uniref:hypothetical protein n=1 Tax=Streptomyces sp. NBC_01288 TaxID=2903814 RepID=UPI002E15B403|nr:hypothetical protein OG194_11430 [Streptomyces sp. NBC_01288]
MSERRPEAPGITGGPKPKPIPRDLPDQQAGADADEQREPEGRDPGNPDPTIPDTDEAGTGKRGAAHSGNARPGHPVPDEPPG